MTEDESAPANEDEPQKTLTSSQPEASNEDEAGSDDDDNVCVGAKQLLRRRMLTNARAIFEDNSSNDSFASKADDNQATQQVSLGSSDVTITTARYIYPPRSRPQTFRTNLSLVDRAFSDWNKIGPASFVI